MPLEPMLRLMLFCDTRGNSNRCRSRRHIFDHNCPCSNNRVFADLDPIDDRGSGVDVTAFPQSHVASGYDTRVDLTTTPQHVVVINLNPCVNENTGFDLGLVANDATRVNPDTRLDQGFRKNRRRRMDRGHKIQTVFSRQFDLAHSHPIVRSQRQNSGYPGASEFINPIRSRQERSAFEYAVGRKGSSLRCSLLVLCLDVYPERFRRLMNEAGNVEASDLLEPRLDLAGAAIVKSKHGDGVWPDFNIDVPPATHVARLNFPRAAITRSTFSNG